MAQTLYVNPSVGNDSASGNESAPLKTIATAISKAQADTTIQLAPGTYNASSGEKFPLKVPFGVNIIGDEGKKGIGTLIEGGGDHVSPTLALQNITLLLANSCELRGVTVTNTERRGTGVWVESTKPLITNCTFTKCNRDGILATGTAEPKIIENIFVDNSGQGITFRKDSAGEVRKNTCKQMASGIDVGDNATPLVINNTTSGNRFGMTILNNAKPILRKNLIEKNTDDGIAVTGKAFPDLGSDSEPGDNVFRDNGKYDINNSGSNELISIGNELNLSKINGKVKTSNNSAGGGAGSGTDPGDVGGGTGGETGGGTGGETGGGTGGETGGGTGNNPELTDIKGHWAEDFIRVLLDKDIVSGFQDGTFKPDQKVTRAQYAAIIVKAFNPAAKRPAKTFSDVSSDFWATEVIQKAYRGEFLSGYPNGTFKPNDQVQRAQVLVSLVNGLGLSADANNALNFYDDRVTVPNYAVDAVKTATMKKMVVNYPNLKRLQPTAGATRAEVAAMVHQALVDAGKTSAIASPYIVVYEPSDNAFPDISGHWAEPFIKGLSEKGLISGYPDGTFKPDRQITRAQYAALLAKAFELNPKREAKNFSDVGTDFWATEVIQKAYRAQFLSGFPNNTFRPNENTQRVQVLVSLVNGLGLSESSAGALDKYDDSNQIPSYANDEVETATAKGMVVNYPNLKQLNPTKSATRAEVVAMVYQALVDEGKLASVDSSYIVSV